MTAIAANRINVSIGLLGTVLGVIVTLVGVSIAFGGYREKVDKNTKDIDLLQSNSASKEDVHRIEGGILEIQRDVKKILEANSSQRRR